MTSTTTTKLTIERAEDIIANLWGHRDWKVYRVFGTETEGVARARRSDEEQLYVINDGRVVSRC